MLEIIVPAGSLWDSENEKFIIVPESKLKLEHSLLALSKWEAKWEEPFLEKISNSLNPLTEAQLRSYVECMSLKPIPSNVLMSLSQDNILAINAYLNSKQTATTITESKQRPGKKQIWTAELFYYNMFANQIPLEVERWNLNRLLMLFGIFRIEAEKQDPKKKRRTRDEINQYYDDREALNAKRKAMLQSKG